MEIIKNTAEVFKLYNGNAIYMTLFLCGLLYLWKTEEDKGKKVILVYGSMVFLGFFFFPLTAYLIHLVDAEVYYRVLWFLPVSVVIAYVIVKLIAAQKKMGRKIVITFLACAILVSGGTYVYGNPTFEKAENAYHIPQEVIDVCDVIAPENQGEWVSAVFPQEMISYVRQYNANIRMPYGREALIERWNLWHPMYQTMEAEIVYAKTLAKQAHEAGCAYIILHEDRAFDEDIEQWGYLLQKSVDGYNIYLDCSEELGIDLEED